MVLLYHFAKNGMTCPCCRAGPAERMDEACVPRHFKEGFLGHLKREQERDEHESEEEALHIATQQTQEDIETFIQGHPMVLTVVSFADADSRQPLNITELSLTCFESEREVQFLTSGHEVRNFGINLMLLPVRVGAIEVCVGLQDLFLHSRQVFLDRSRRFALEQEDPAQRDLPMPSTHPWPGVTLSLRTVGVGNNQTVPRQFAWTAPKVVLLDMIVRAMQVHIRGVQEATTPMIVVD